MRFRYRCKQKGFTLIELLLVIAIIGLIAAMLVPNLLDAMQKAKQKRTMADQRLVGTAMMAWLTDQEGAGAAGQANQFSIGFYSVVGIDSLRATLIPQYIQAIPENDGWVNPVDYRMNLADPSAAQVMAIRSLGRDGTAEGTQYTTGAFQPTDYDRDIVWADGFFVRWPQGISTTAN
jgi:prepilin-type N-terminal cleavage/methylation domain-containing protein